MNLTDLDEKVLLEVLSFVPAGELFQMASVNRSCQKLAKTSFRQRCCCGGGATTSTTSTSTSSSTSNKTIMPILELDNNSPLPVYYKKENPWCNIQHRFEYNWIGEGEDRQDKYKVVHIQFQKRNNRRQPYGEKQEFQLELPDTLLVPTQTPPPLITRYGIHHASLVDGSLLLVVTKTYGNELEEDYDEYEPDPEGSRQELWGITYNVAAQSEKSETQKQQSKYKYSIVQQLQGPMPPELYSPWCDDVAVGDTVRNGGNGKLFCVITCLFNSEEFDEVPEEYATEYPTEDSPAYVSIYEITTTTDSSSSSANTINLKYKIQLPSTYSNFLICFNMEGTILSILNLWHDNDAGMWIVYDISGNNNNDDDNNNNNNNNRNNSPPPPPPPQLMNVKGFREAGHAVFFTPDNEFVYIYSDVRKEGGIGTLINEGFPSMSFLFAKRVIIKCT